VVCAAELALAAHPEVERHSLAFGKLAVPNPIDGREVHEEVAFVMGDHAPAKVIEKPSDLAVCPMDRWWNVLARRLPKAQG